MMTKIYNRDRAEVQRALTDWEAGIYDGYSISINSLFFDLGYDLFGGEELKTWLNKEVWQFTDFEIDLLKRISTDYHWIARDISGALFIYDKKPYKPLDGVSGQWKVLSEDVGDWICFPLKSTFESIQWDDSEPVCIDDYVDRKGEQNETSNL